MKRQVCAHCGSNDIVGYAQINDDWYCHPDVPWFTCYQIASWKMESEMMSGWFDEMEEL